MKILAIISIVMLFSTAYAATPFFANGGLTKNGIEWCEENYQLYNFMGEDFFEHHQHSIESRVCGNLYNDSLWTYAGYDRYEKLVEKSKYYAALEIEESRSEAETGVIDTKPVNQEEIPQVIAQQQERVEEKQKEVEQTEQQDIAATQPKDTELNSEGGGCLIATAAYGSEMAPQVQFLREIRDGKIMSTGSGAAFMTGFNQFYYSFSPAIADYERENPVFKEMVKIGITPMLASLFILNHVTIDSEQELLGYGIGVILMNLGMYFAAPAIVFCKVKKRL